MSATQRYKLIDTRTDRDIPDCDDLSWDDAVRRSYGFTRYEVCVVKDRSATDWHEQEMGLL